MAPNPHRAGDLDRSLTNQPPKNDEVVGRMEHLSAVAKSFGFAILATVPEGREQTLAITKLEESVMWAMKGIALNQGDEG